LKKYPSTISPRFKLDSISYPLIVASLFNLGFGCALCGMWITLRNITGGYIEKAGRGGRKTFKKEKRKARKVKKKERRRLRRFLREPGPAAPVPDEPAPPPLAPSPTPPPPAAAAPKPKKKTRRFQQAVVKILAALDKKVSKFKLDKFEPGDVDDFERRRKRLGLVNLESQEELDAFRKSVNDVFKRLKRGGPGRPVRDAARAAPESPAAAVLGAPIIPPPLGPVLGAKRKKKRKLNFDKARDTEIFKLNEKINQLDKSKFDEEAVLTAQEFLEGLTTATIKNKGGFKQFRQDVRNVLSDLKAAKKPIPQPREIISARFRDKKGKSKQSITEEAAERRAFAKERKKRAPRKKKGGPTAAEIRRLDVASEARIEALAAKKRGAREVVGTGPLSFTVPRRKKKPATPKKKTPEIEKIESGNCSPQDQA